MLFNFTARIAVVKPTGNPIICKTDEVGELVMQSPGTGSAYWGLSGRTTTTFKVRRAGLLLLLSSIVWYSL